MKINLKKLNSRGVAHHLLIAVVAVTFVAGFGAYKVFFSKAAVSYETRSSIVYISQADGKGCWLAGRNWDGNSCNKTCRAAGSNFVAATSTHLGYCTGAIAPEVSQSWCGDLGRRYVNSTGCSKRIDQDNTAAATQCIYSNNTYIANNGADHCAISCSGQWLNNRAECPIAPAPVVAPAPTPAPAPVNNAAGGAASPTPAPAPVNNAAGGAAAAPTPGATDTTNAATVPDDGTGDDGETAEVVTATPPTPTENIVTVEADTKHTTCVQLLGREWIPAKKIKKKTTPAGCSSTKCHSDGLKIVQNPSGADYCQGFMAGEATTNAICDKLHRVWVPEANRCAQNPNQKKVKVNGAKQCQAPYTVYLFHTATRDECLKPTTVQKAEQVANTVGKNTVGKAASVGPAATCKAKGGSYQDGKCSSTTKKATAIETAKGGGGPSVTQTTCEKVHRKYFANSGKCAYSEKFGQDKGSGLCSPDTLYYWHYASSKKDECKSTRQPTVFDNLKAPTTPASAYTGKPYDQKMDCKTYVSKYLSSAHCTRKGTGLFNRLSQTCDPTGKSTTKTQYVSHFVKSSNTNYYAFVCK